MYKTNYEDAPLTPEQANKIYDLLIEHAGASESWRDDFLYHQTREHVPEYRFQGLLGFGGKFRRNSRWYGKGETWLVDCYPEDRSPERDKLVEATNKALSALELQESEEDS
jgi:hypothetical protein